MFKSFSVFIKVLRIACAPGMLMSMLYSSALWILPLLYGAFNPGKIVVCVIMSVVICLLSFVVLGNLKYRIFQARTNFRSLISLYSDKKSRTNLIQYCGNPGKDVDDGYDDWFIEISDKALVFLDPLIIDFNKPITFEERIFFEDAFKKRAFCESWRYNVFHIALRNGRALDITLEQRVSFRTWINCHGGKTRKLASTDDL